MSEIISNQFNQVKDHYKDAELTWYPDGVAVMTATVMTPHSIWNKDRTRVWVLIPVGYPIAKPDCFWTEPDLRLSNGSMPINAGFNPLPQLSQQQLLWFSWHTSMWNPNRDSLLTYMHTVERRLREAR